MRKDVRNGAKTVLLALVCNALAATAQAESTPYDAIASRNIFALGEEKHGVPPVEPPKPSTSFKLTGITTVLGVKQAMLLVNEPENKAKSPGAHSVMLCEGQHFAKLDVLQINPTARTVRVRNDGVESELSFNVTEARK